MNRAAGSRKTVPPRVEPMPTSHVTLSIWVPTDCTLADLILAAVNAACNTWDSLGADPKSEADRQRAVDNARIGPPPPLTPAGGAS